MPRPSPNKKVEGLFCFFELLGSLDLASGLSLIVFKPSSEAIGKEDLPPLDNVLPLAEVEGDDSVLCRDFDALVLR